MHVPPKRWAVIYYASTAASMATLVAIPTLILVENLDPIDRSDAFGWLGASAGALLGLWLAWAKRSSPTTHRTLRIVGAWLGLLGLAGGLVMYALSQRARDTSGVFLAGLGEAIVAVLALAVAGIGASLWLAGFSGRRTAPTDGVPERSKTRAWKGDDDIGGGEEVPPSGHGGHEVASNGSDPDDD